MIYFLRTFALISLLLCIISCSSDSEARPSGDPETWESFAFPESDCEWTDLTPSAIPKLESYPVIVGNKLYTFSGFTNGLAVIPETEIYDLNTGQWSFGASMPLPVTHMGVARVNDDIWIVGGFAGDHPGTATSRVQIYSPGNDQWREGPELPVARASGSLVLVNGKLHHFGGLLPDRRTDIDEHWVLDLNNINAGWKADDPLPIARNHLGGVALNGNIYAVGGQFGHDGGNEDVPFVHVYSTDSGDWERLADMPLALSHFEAGIFVFENRIYVVGGISPNGAQDTIFVYDPQSDTWSEFCGIPQRLLAPGARMYGNQLLVLNGGVNGAGSPINAFRYINLINK